MFFGKETSNCDQRISTTTSSSSSSSSSASNQEYNNNNNNNNQNDDQINNLNASIASSSSTSLANTNNNNNNANSFTHYRDTKSEVSRDSRKSKINNEEVEDDEADDDDDNVGDLEMLEDDEMAARSPEIESDLDEANNNNQLRTNQSQSNNNRLILVEDNSISQDNDASNASNAYNAVLSDSEQSDSATNQYTRLTRTVRSYLNATTSTRDIDQTNQSLNNNDNNTEITTNLNNSVNLSDFISNTQHNSTAAHHHSFKSKSFLFKSLLEKYDANRHDFEKKINQFKNRKNLNKLIKLFTTHENYHSTMLMPIADNFKLDWKMNNSSLKKKKMKKETCDSEDDDLDQNDNEQEEEEDIDEDEENEEFYESSLNLIENFSRCKMLKTNDATNTLISSYQKSNEFHTCQLCSHCLYEPITLVCGCTFCKSCLNEHNFTLIKIKLKQLARIDAANNLRLVYSINNTEDLEISNNNSKASSNVAGGESGSGAARSSDLRSLSKQVYKCFTCGKAHDHNTSEKLKTNIFLTKVVEKLWRVNLDVKQLRNDIRSFVCYNFENNEPFDLEKYEYLFIQAYNLDRSNHLILADLFLINYFSGQLENCLRYAQQACELKPNWSFLDPTIEQIKIKLHQIFSKSTYASMTRETTLKLLKQTDAKQNTLKQNQQQKHISKLSENNPKTQQKNSNAIKRSISFNNSSLHESNNRKHPKFNSNADFGELKKSRTNEEEANSSSSNSNQVYFEISNSTDESRSSTSNTPRPAHATTKSTLTYDSSRYFAVDSNLLKPSDLECSLCLRLLYNPVTTPCGHTFCCSCLDRSLDHQDKCPLCKNSLADYLGERRQNTTAFLDKLIRNYFQNEFKERKKQYEEELKELNGQENTIPIFVCTLSMPFIPCPLHIYEPRYKLMLRRAIETGSNQFGMCLYTETTPYRYTEYGCMLEIRSYQFIRDGRAVVATIGGRRFKVIKAASKDGYNIAQVEWVVDNRVESEQEKTELQNLHDEVYRLASFWYNLLPQSQKDKIYEIYGVSDFPDSEADIQSNGNGPFWHWFLLSILPIENDFQYKFLKKTSLKDRLLQMKRILIAISTRFPTSRSQAPPTPSSSQTSSSEYTETQSTNPQPTTSRDSSVDANIPTPNPNNLTNNNEPNDDQQTNNPNTNPNL